MLLIAETLAISALSREIKSFLILFDSQVFRNLVRSHGRHLEIADFSTTFTYLLIFLLLSSLDLSSK